MTYFIVALITGIICGVICESISKSRGMTGGFLWGLLLGIIGIIVVAVRPNDGPAPTTLKSSHVLYCKQCNMIYNYDIAQCSNCNSPLLETSILRSDWKEYSAEKRAELKEAFSNGQNIIDRSKDSEITVDTTGATVSSEADEILKFKELLDKGIITQEEFDAKKKQLLGL